MNRRLYTKNEHFRFAKIVQIFVETSIYRVSENIWPSRISGLLLAVLLFPALLSAQNPVSGTVTDESGAPLQGARVMATVAKTGAMTDSLGRFRLTAATIDTLKIDYFGYPPVFQPVAGPGPHTVKMIPYEQEEVVITAFGMQREKKALGYSVSEVNVVDMVNTRDVNLANSISGKIAGVQVTKTTGGPASSTRIVLRGNSSLRLNNQPLIVVDGVPIDNTTRGSGGMWGGVDFGSPISDINPDDIASMTILKGPNAAALYGSRAANGVIVVATKKGRSNKGIGVTINSTVSVERAYIQRKFQNRYGAGFDGRFQYNADSIPYFNNSMTEADSWGPEMLGQSPYIDWDGETRSYSPQPNNWRDFFETGHTLTNSVSLQGGNDTANFRLSYTNLENKGTHPGTKFQRNNLTFRGSTHLTSKLQVDAKISYVRQHARNRLNQSDGRGAARNFNFMPRNISLASLRDYKDADGNEKVWYTDWAWQSNPYWMVYENLNEDWRDRFIGMIAVRYQLTPWLSAQVRTGMDYFNERRQRRTASGSFENPDGDYSENWLGFVERNSDFLLSADKQVNENLRISGNFGGNLMLNRYEDLFVKANRLAIPGLYHTDNAIESEITTNNYLARKAINSLYGSAQISWKNYLFLDLTGRNDWSSTLPAANRSYFYPSASLSFVATDAFGIESQLLTFAKLRASWAFVGSDADPYMLDLTYSENRDQKDYFGAPRYQVASVSPLPDLQPENTGSVEIGGDFRFFQNRLGIDVAYYKQNTVNQIVEANVSGASGFSRAVVNAGEIENQGIELLVSATPVNTRSITWVATMNFTRNRSLVKSLAEGMENHQLGEQWGTSIEARPGNPYGDIVAISIARDDNGNKLVDSTGMYVKGERKVLGNINPDWMMGITNEFSVKGFYFRFLVDIRKGGHIYSASNMYGMGYSGNFVETLEGREEWYASEEERIAAGVSSANWNATGGFLAEGVYEAGATVNGQDVSGQTNATYVNPKAFWSQFSRWGNELHEPHVYDASFVKLREMFVGYQVPAKISGKMKMRGLNIGIFARNLWVIHKNVPNIDPEAAYNNGNGQGLEYASFPVARSFGINLGVRI